MDIVAMDTAGRIPRLQALLPAAGCDGLVISQLSNIRYLTGFTGSAAIVLVTADEAVLVTDGRYDSQSAEELSRARVTARIEVGLPPVQEKVLEEAAIGLRRIGLEAGSVSWARQRHLAADVFVRAELVATDGLVESLRLVKDEGELGAMRTAAAIADAALARVRPQLVAGIAEVEVANTLDFEMRTLGATRSSFETIVASGPNGAKPHARPSRRLLERGELVVMDFGAVFDGYCSDMTRTLCIGEPASAALGRMVEVVRASQAAGLASVRAGVAASEVDSACRTVIAEAGWSDAFVHGTGHGVGLDIHEGPRVGPTSDATLLANSVITVEPGVYLPDHGGVRIEDTVVVTAEGCRPLTTSPKDLMV
ncbi:MAG: hypothetical protein DLM54_08275 [Acidimicrobiales bacterium]|nr:MAG: hypothetical protein DLM54_08275 [Acidimicrobiales bacterium]